jgi:GTP cyclohydrolase III
MIQSESIREIVKELRMRARADNLNPAEAQDIAIKAASITGNCTNDIREAELAYNQVLLKARREERSAKDGEIVAKTTPEYQRYREAIDTFNEVKALSSTLKAVLRYKNEEMRHGL